ncbi:unnamed protein product [Closterium sp. NIES-53]
MASLHVLVFDHEGRPLQFDTWLDDLQLYLLSHSRDRVSLFDHTSSAAHAPPATADSATRSQWLTRDAAACLAIRNHLPLAECAHFGQHRTGQALYYFSPNTAALGRLLLPYLFPELSAFATVEDLVSHLCTSDARYRAALPAEFLAKNPPPVYITLYFIVTRLPDSLRAALLVALRAHPSLRGAPPPPLLPPMPLLLLLTSLVLWTSEPLLLVQSAAAARARVAGVEAVAAGVVVGAAVEVVGGVEVVAALGVVAGVGALVAAVEAEVGVAIVAAVGVVAVGQELRVEVLEETRGSSSSVGARPRRPSSFVSGFLSVGRMGVVLAAQFGDEAESPRWAELLRSGVAIFDAILAAMYALSASAKGDCYLCVPPHPGIEAAALGASESVLPGTAPAEALHTFTLDSGGPVLALSSTVLPCPAVPSGSLSGLHLPSFSTNLTLPWHHRLGHPSLPCLRGLHSRLLISSLPRSLPPLPPSPAPPCLPCIKEQQCAAPHSSLFPPTFAPLQTLQMDIDLPVLCLHSNRGGRLWSAYTALDGEGWRCVWGSCAFVHNTSADKFFARAIPYVFLGFSPDTPGWQFYHPTSRRVFPSQDVTFHESVPFYRLFPYRSAPLPPPPLFFAPGPPPVDPLPSGVSQVDPLPGTAPVEVAVGSGAAPDAASGDAVSGGEEPGGAKPGGAGSEGVGSGGAEPEGAESEGAGSGGAEPGGVELAGVEPGGAEPESVEPRGTASEDAESGGAEQRGTTSSEGPAGAPPRVSPRPEPLSAQQLREWFAQRTCLRSGAAGAGVSAARDTRAGGAGVGAGAGSTGGTAAAGRGGALTGGTEAAGTGGVGGAGAGAPTEPGAAGGGGAGAIGAGAGGTNAGGAGDGGAGVVDPGAGGAGGTVGPRLYFVPLLQQVLRVPSSPDQSQPPLQPTSPLPAPSPYTEQTGGLTERREPASSTASLVRTGRCVPRPRPPPVPGTHAITLRPSSVPLHVPLPPPPESFLPAHLDPKSDRARAASPTVSRLLATVVTDPSSESTVASALVAELVDFAAACRLDYASALVADSRSEDFECLAAAVPRFPSMQLAPEGDPDAQDIPTPHSYAKAIMGPYSSEWQAAMDAEMASWKSTCTYVDAVPPSRTNIVNGMWFSRVKRSPGSPPAFKARYVAQGFSQRQGVDYFHTFSPTSKMYTLWMLLHVAAQRDYELHSLDFSTQWSLRRPVYGLCKSPCKWHDTLRTILAALGFTPTADPSVFLRTDTSLQPFYVLVYVHELFFATANTEALTLVKSELQKRHTCTDLGELRSYLGLQINRDRARRTITLTQSHMVHQVLQRFGFQFFSSQPTPLSTGHSLSAPPSDESVEPSGPYP